MWLHAQFGFRQVNLEGVPDPLNSRSLKQNCQIAIEELRLQVICLFLTDYIKSRWWCHRGSQTYSWRGFWPMMIRIQALLRLLRELKHRVPVVIGGKSAL